jgi:hypothetical protein
MNKGTLLKVNGRLATTTSDCYTRMVYDLQDYDLAAAGYEGGSACSFVDVVFNESGVRCSMNLSRPAYSIVVQ